MAEKIENDNITINKLFKIEDKNIFFINEKFLVYKNLFTKTKIHYNQDQFKFETLTSDNKITKICKNTEKKKSINTRKLLTLKKKFNFSFTEILNKNVKKKEKFFDEANVTEVIFSKFNEFEYYVINPDMKSIPIIKNEKSIRNITN